MTGMIGTGRWIVTRGLRIVGLVALAAGLWFGHRYAIGNVHTVEAGVLYRSGTLSGHALKTLIEEKGIKTIINLRGANPQRVWYQSQVAIAQAHGVHLVDVGMSAHREPPAATVDRLLVAFATAQRPILVHCEAGADRSSFASAVFAHLHLGQSASQARRQLTLYYGHETLTDPRKLAMGRAFERMVAARRDQTAAPLETAALSTH